MTTDSAAPSDPRFAELERALAAAGASPRLVWYGPDRERIELSGAVLLNWAAKTANLLVEECDVEPGDAVLIDAPVHWRTLAIALGCWQAGAAVAVGTSGEDVRVRFWAPPVAAPGRAAGSGADGPTAYGPGVNPETDVAVSLGALDLAFPGRLRPGIVDYAAEIRAYGDGFMGDPVAESITLTRDDAAVPFATPTRRRDDSTPDAGWPSEGTTADTGIAPTPAPGAAASGRGRDLLGAGRHAATSRPGGTGAGATTGTPGRTVALDPGLGLAETLAAAVPCWLRGGAILVADAPDRITDTVLRDERAVRVD